MTQHPRNRRVRLMDGPLDGESRSVLWHARRDWFLERLSSRRHEYRQTADQSVWVHVPEKGGDEQ